MAQGKCLRIEGALCLSTDGLRRFVAKDAHRPERSVTIA